MSGILKWYEECGLSREDKFPGSGFIYNDTVKKNPGNECVECGGFDLFQKQYVEYDNPFLESYWETRSQVKL